MPPPRRPRNGHQNENRSKKSSLSFSDVIVYIFKFLWAIVSFIFSIVKVICVFGWKTLFGGGSSSSSPANRATSSTSSGTYKVIEGDPNLGSLHSLIRHASQWANVIPSFKSEWSKLPKEARTLVAKVEKGEQPAKGFIESLAKLNLSSKIFSPLEKKTSRFISEHATSSNLVRQGQNSSGQGQRFFSITDALGRLSEMVLGVEGEGKPVITAFFRPASSSSSSFLGAAFQWVIRNWKTVLVAGAAGYFYFYFL